MTAAQYAAALAALLPPGKAWRTNGVLSLLLLAAGDEMARVDARGEDLLREADPRTADEILPDFERVLGLPGTGTLEDRRGRVVALMIRRQRCRPEDFRRVLAPILGCAPEDVVVIERTHDQAVAMGDAREIFRFAVYRNPALPGSYDVAAAQGLIDAMKQSHTLGHLVESVGFRCDDPASLCDRDLLGV